jgi:hypothetical protein
MGCAGSKGDSYAITPEERERQKTIEKLLKAEKIKYDNEIKLLLLGAGQSGKSTLVKQMKVIYMNGFTDDECLQFRDLVHSNVFQAIRELVQGAIQEQIHLHSANAVCENHQTGRGKPSPHFISLILTSSHLTSSHFISSHFFSLHLISLLLTSSHFGLL